MGRIKSLMVKRAARQLLVQKPEQFTESFTYNKQVLGRNMPSIPIRNKIAGYIARLVKMRRIEKEKPAPAPVVEVQEAI
ncbi:30S ribosomal protein S17e [Candidatus Pacearchaeota archaeon]|nr:30S ribosomal protein S17e [Candidatus Pacearchaeota archaeon]